MNTNNNSVIPKFSGAISQAKLMRTTFSPVACVMDPLFEIGTMNMISAAPNTWKSWLVFLFANNIASGSLVFNKFKTEKTNVIIVNEEDSERLIKDRLKALKIRPSLNVFYRVSRGDKLQVDYVDYLIAEAKKLKVGLIFFDSLRAMNNEDENSSMAVQGVMDLFKKITREGITVIFTHHNRKGNDPRSRSNDSEATRGSTAINAAVSGHISLEEKTRTDETLLIISHLKSKIGEKLKPFTVRITRDNGIGFEYVGDYDKNEDTQIKLKTHIISTLEADDKLWSIQDFIDGKFGCKTTIKNVVSNLFKDDKIKMIERKEAEKLGLEIIKEVGQHNEHLYYIEKE